MPQTESATSRGLSLLGGWQLVVDGDVVALGGREQRLCALLALTGTRARAQVAGMLWPESTDARALASLRRAVSQTHQRCPGLLAADRTSVALAADVVVDVDVLRAAVSAAAGPDAVADPSLLVTLAGEQLLPGWYDEWVEAHRDELEHQRVGALERLARAALERGDTTLAEEAARAVARVEPLRESASALLIRALLGRGDRAGAVRELERYRDVVRTELGVVPSPGLGALVEASAPPVAPVVVPAQRRAPVTERAASVLRQVAPPGPPPAGPPPPPDPLSPTGPAGLSRRATAARLAVGAALVLAVSVSVANLGPDRARPTDPVSSGDRLPDAPTARPGPGAASGPAYAREVLVRPVGSTDGAAVFVVRATQRPARVRLEVAGPSGRSLVRSVVVRSRDGQRLVLSGLDGGTYEWSATSPTAAPVVGEVRVQEAEAPALAAAAAPQRDPSPPPTPSPAPSPAPTSTTSSPTATPTPTPTPTPTLTPTPTPSTTPVQQTQQPGPSPSPSPSPTPQPSPTRHPSPPGEPTDPGTQDPGPVG
ncbi:AfsR/SARP family transcriptional regulator [Nocardioides sp. T5]|uniref:AfsR/SARP family transcriptional regulator n=1 Tax=Nocardioides sp. T5 TaxID=3400182 RepID=UPI003A84303F